MGCHFEDNFVTVCSRYKRKGSSSLGLDPHRQGVSWEESNKKQKGGNKKAADRYFSTVSRQLLRSEPPVPTLPTIPEASEALSPAYFLPLGDEEANKERESGRRCTEKYPGDFSASDATNVSRLNPIFTKHINSASH